MYLCKPSVHSPLRSKGTKYTSFHTHAYGTKWTLFPWLAKVYYMEPQNFPFIVFVDLTPILPRNLWTFYYDFSVKLPNYKGMTLFSFSLICIEY